MSGERRSLSLVVAAAAAAAGGAAGDGSGVLDRVRAGVRVVWCSMEMEPLRDTRTVAPGSGFKR